MITPHRVKCDLDHGDSERTLLRRLADFDIAVKAAIAAYAMGDFRLSAMGTLDDGGRLQLPMGFPLVAARR